jgi:hypothetical protein
MERRTFLQRTVGGLELFTGRPGISPDVNPGVAWANEGKQTDLPPDDYRVLDWLQYARMVYFDGYSPPVYPASQGPVRHSCKPHPTGQIALQRTLVCRFLQRAGGRPSEGQGRLAQELPLRSRPKGSPTSEVGNILCPCDTDVLTNEPIYRFAAIQRDRPNG